MFTGFTFHYNRLSHFSHRPKTRITAGPEPSSILKLFSSKWNGAARRHSRLRLKPDLDGVHSITPASFNRKDETIVSITLSSTVSLAK